jgi:hypothetical protein
MRLSGNVRQIATVTLVCGALLAAGYAPALANNKHHGHHHWWDYLYGRMESLSRTFSTLGSRLTSRLDALTRRVDALAATGGGGGQDTSALAARVDQLASDLTQLGAKLDTHYLSVSNRISGLDTGLNLKITEVSTSLSNLAGTVNGRIESLTARVARLEEVGGAAGSGGRVVIDSNGKKIGDFAGLDPFSLAPLVAMSDDAGRSFVLQVYPNRLKGELYFANSDCTGAAYIPRFTGDANSSISLAGVRNNTVYVTNANVLSDSFVMVHSAATDQAPDFCENMTQTVRVLPVTSQMELVAVPPFLVK